MTKFIPVFHSSPVKLLYNIFCGLCFKMKEISKFAFVFQNQSRFVKQEKKETSLTFSPEGEFDLIRGLSNLHLNCSIWFNPELLHLVQSAVVLW